MPTKTDLHAPDFHTWLKPKVATPSQKNGAKVWENSKIFFALTSLNGKSENGKTSGTVQSWILAKGEKPSEAVKSGKDKLICGDCPMRGDKGKNRGCYVVPFMGPNAVYAAADQYCGEVTKSDLTLRFGSYGDPAMVPFRVIERLAKKFKNSLGYTHQWRDPRVKKYAKYLMASVESPEGKKQANETGFRTFRVMPAGAKLEADEILCPASKEAGFKLTCAQCGLCNGNRTGRKNNVAIYAHGSPVAAGRISNQIAQG